MSLPILRLTRSNDEELEIVFDGHHIYTASHDMDGWQGMDAVETVARGIAKVLNLEVIEEEEFDG